MIAAWQEILLWLLQLISILHGRTFFLKLLSQTGLGTAAHKVSGHTFFYKPFQSFYTPFSVSFLAVLTL